LHYDRISACLNLAVALDSANLRRHVIPWDRPLLPQAVAFLAGGWDGAGPLDLSRLLVVVPTRQSGRRLREALAVCAAARGQSVWPPRVSLPEDLLHPVAPGTAIASRLESLLAWGEVLRRIELEAFRDVFPVDPPERSFTWARQLGAQLMRVQATLAEAGLRFGDVPASAGPSFPEEARWTQLASLERLYDEALARRGLCDEQAAKVAFAAGPVLPPGIARIVVLGTPDPLPLAVAVLGRHANTLPVDVVVAGPPAEDAETLFDAWGRPRTEAWSRRPVAWPGFEERVRLCADPSVQAERIVALARHYGEPEGILGIGVADPDVLPSLEHGLLRSGIAAFDPEGTPRQRGTLFALLAALADLARDPAFDAASALARCPDVLVWLQGELGREFSPAGFLAALDQLRTDHLPPTLDEARRHAGPAGRREPGGAGADREMLAAGLQRIAGLRETLVSGPFPAGPVAALARLFAARLFDLTQAADRARADDAEAWRELREAVGRSAKRFPEVSDGEWWEISLGLFGETRRFDERPAGAVELLGWLELLWEDAPHLVVAGFNDGCVPEAVAGDAFVPEALREKLGLKTNAARLARDAYLLAALAAGRDKAGRLDLLVGKVSAAGDPLRPSRLLLLCDDAALPARVRFLFSAADSPRASLPWRRAWTLCPPRLIPAVDHMGVTAFRDYLACPFRFYLKHALRMEAVDPAKAELDARDFGNLCHAALQALGEEPALRDCTDEGVLRDFLLAELARAARAGYGERLTLPILVQIESARQRLSRAAAVQAGERAAGWVIEQVEWRFPAAPALAFGGLAVSGKIDRVDRNERTGAVRVLDYKTSDRAVRPREAHCRRPRRDGSDGGRPAWARFMFDGIEWVWTDLQLPLYVRAVAAEFGEDAACGYFNLPKAAGETAVASWDDYSAATHAAALRCAEGVAAAVAAGCFWPPAERPAREDEDWPGLFHEGAAAGIAEGWAEEIAR
jgi:ATP-dependent helicase/nuclease subunit B